MKKRLLTVLLPIAVLFCTEQLFAQKTTSAPKTKEQILGWLCEKIAAEGLGSNLTGTKDYFAKDSVTVLSCSYEQGNILLNYELISESNNIYDSAMNQTDKSGYVNGFPYLQLVIKENFTVKIPFTQLKAITVHKKESNNFYDYDYISFETKNVSIRQKRNSYKLLRHYNHQSLNNTIEAIKQEGLKDPNTVEEKKYKTFKINMNFLDNPNLPQKLQNAINDLKKHMITGNELY
jgi:hypothetical protein